MKLMWRVKLVTEVESGVTTLRVGSQVAQEYAVELQDPPVAPGPVVVGLDGGYVRGRHRAEGRRFEVVAGKVIHTGGGQHRFAFTRTGPIATTDAFRAAFAAAGVGANTPATVLCDADAGLWRLKRRALPGATVMLDWWYAAVRFEHALQAARSLGRGTVEDAFRQRHHGFRPANDDYRLTAKAA